MIPTAPAPAPELTPPADLPDQVAAALREDIGSGDVTAQLVPQDQRVSGRVITREDAVLCGRPWAEETFRRLDGDIRLTWRAKDGERIAATTVIFEIEGPARPILTGERTAIDTRKTIPGLRSAQKYAVRCGGGRNHRMGLYDMVLIKENHIAAAGSISAAIGAARRVAQGIKVEVEVESLAELQEALRAGPDIVLLDDFSLEDLAAAVSLNRSLGRPVALEASGSVSLETVRAIAATGIDFVSSGGLTKNVRAVDLSMRLDFV